MKAKIEFIKMFRKLPEKAREELVYNFPVHPMSLNVVYFEVSGNTKKSNEILRRLGYEDD